MLNVKLCKNMASKELRDEFYESQEVEDLDNNNVAATCSLPNQQERPDSSPKSVAGDSSPRPQFINPLFTRESVARDLSSPKSTRAEDLSPMSSPMSSPKLAGRRRLSRVFQLQDSDEEMSDRNPDDPKVYSGDVSGMIPFFGLLLCTYCMVYSIFRGKC